jgi:hypothetical protein
VRRFPSRGLRVHSANAASNLFVPQGSACARMQGWSRAPARSRSPARRSSKASAAVLRGDQPSSSCTRRTSITGPRGPDRTSSAGSAGAGAASSPTRRGERLRRARASALRGRSGELGRVEYGLCRNVERPRGYRRGSLADRRRRHRLSGRLGTRAAGCQGQSESVRAERARSERADPGTVAGSRLRPPVKI